MSVFQLMSTFQRQALAPSAASTTFFRRPLCTDKRQRGRVVPLVLATFCIACHPWMVSFIRPGCARQPTFAGSSGLDARHSLRVSLGPAQPRVARGAWDSFQEFAQDPVVSMVGWSVVLASLTILRVAVAEESDTPAVFLQNLSVSPSEAAVPDSPVICVGDSLTRGNLSADWVGKLRQMLTNDTNKPVLNAGVNMQCISNVKERIEQVVACKPSHVTVLVGTNDLKAQASAFEGWLYKVFGKIPKVGTLETYEQDLAEIRDRLLAAGARVALVSPPVLGEDINSAANQRAKAFAEAVQRTAANGGERCAYFPLFEQTCAELPKTGGAPYDGFRFFYLLCQLCFDIHVFRRDLSDVQRERELEATLDLVHLGPKPANYLAEMTAKFVTATAQDDMLRTTFALSEVRRVLSACSYVARA